MSEIDPMVQELIDATRNAAQAGGADNDEWRDETAQRLTERLTQPAVTREKIRAAVYNAGCKTDENFWTLWTDTPQSSINMWLDAITDAVMAVLEPEQGGE